MNTSSGQVLCRTCGRALTEAYVQKVRHLLNEGKRVNCQTCHAEWVRNRSAGGSGFASARRGGAGSVTLPPVSYGDFSTVVTAAAERRADALRDDRVTFTKLRRYYAEFESLLRAARVNQDDPVTWEKITLRLGLIRAKAQYDRNRKMSGMGTKGLLADLVQESVQRVKTVDDLELVKRHLEAVVAYAKGVLK